MALTLLEQSKLNGGTEVQQAVIEVFASASPILMVLPFREIQGNALRYNREKALPSIAFRGVNGSFTSSTGVINPQVEALTIVGGEVEVDPFITRTEGAGARARHETMMLKSIAEGWQTSFFKGDTSTDDKEIDGLQVRVTGSQIVQPGSPTSGGDAPSLFLLDTAISRVLRPTHILMNKRLALRLSAAARDTDVGGFVTWEPGEFGRRIMQYNGLPVLEIEDSLGEDTVLPFTEANPGGGSAASTSIYVVSIGPGMLEGIQNGGMSVRDIGESYDNPMEKTRIEWYSGFSIFHGRAVARYNGIKDAAWTA